MTSPSEPDGSAERSPWWRLRRVRRTAAALVFVIVAGAGSVVGVMVAGSTQAQIGPLDTTLEAVPGRSGTTVSVAPFGRIDIASHQGPVGLGLRVDQLREQEARAIAEDPAGIELDEAALTRELRDGIRTLIQRVVLSAVVGGALAGLLLRRRWTAGLAGGLVGLVLAASTAGLAADSWDTEALAEPRYHGLLRYAPEAVGDARDVVDEFNDYQAQVAGVIDNVVSLYAGATEIRSFRADATTTRVLHVSDLHLNPQGFDLIDQVAVPFGVDLVVDTGDINDWGTTFESTYADRIGALDVPYLYIRGNHDSATTARSVARQPNARVLEGEQITIAGLSFWGDGDPRFTPDKSRAGSGADQREVAEDEAPKVARAVRALDSPPDVVLVHDPIVGSDLGGLTPLVLAGHRHAADQQELDGGTRLFVEGSTGGAGLRSLQKDDAVPLSCSVLYFDTVTGRLEAVDRIEVAGVNQAEVRIEREVYDPIDPDRSPGPGTDPGDRPSTATSTTSTSTSTTSTTPGG